MMAQIICLLKLNRQKKFLMKRNRKSNLLAGQHLQWMSWRCVLFLRLPHTEERTTQYPIKTPAMSK